MKNKIVFLIWIVMSAGLARAADLPKLSVYYTSPGDASLPLPLGIFKLSNPTPKTFYVYGMSITDLPVLVQILKDEKWMDEPNPPFRCGTGSSFYPLFPGASLLFQSYAPEEANAKWRVKVFISKEAEPQSERVAVVSPAVQITEQPRF
jgi:hypothetical protein